MHILLRFFLLTLLLQVSFTLFSEEMEVYDEELLTAILNDDVVKVKAFLDGGGDIEMEVIDCSFSLLYTAANNGSLEVSKLLVERGADRSSLDRGWPGNFDDTPLVNSIIKGNYEMAEFLIDIGVDVGLAGEEDRVTSPLSLAIREGEYRMFELLLKNGASPLEQELDGQSALRLALKNDDEKALELLVKYGHYKDYRWIRADVGLRMRSTPSLQGKKLGVIPFGERVVLLEERGELLTIAGAKGRWSRVRWNENEGWVFGGFLAESCESDIMKMLSSHLWVWERDKEVLEEALEFFEDGTFKFYFMFFTDIVVESSGNWFYDSRKGSILFHHTYIFPESYLAEGEFRAEEFEEFHFDKESGRLSYYERGVSKQLYTIPMSFEEFKKVNEEKAMEKLRKALEAY